MDLLRAALGDEQLTYLGFSYGTAIGAVYATLFPDNVRALVLDGSVSPSATEEEQLLAQALGFERALGNFVEGCNADPGCAIGPDAAAAVAEARAELEAQPIEVATESGPRELGRDLFDLGVATALYDATLWGTLASSIANLDEGGGATLLSLVAARLLLLPWLKLIGAALLVYIGITLLLPEGDEGGDEASSGKGSMASAVRTILIADLVMSLDNVIAVAAAAKGDTFLLVLGLAISIPLVIFGSTLLLKVIERFPLIVWLGAALLGYIAGEIATSDPVVSPWVEQQAQALQMSGHTLGQLVGLIGAAFVVGVSLFLLRRHKIAAL
jgi:YjbE family integral membrane protein